MSCKSTNLKESGSDWLKSGKAVYTTSRNKKMHFSCFHELPGSAEALVR